MKTLSSSFIVLTLLTVSLYAGARDVHADAIIRAPNNLGLVGYWSFDEGRGTKVSDLSGNGNEGTLNGNPAWAVGKSKAALDFDGVEGTEVRVSDNASLDLPNAWTISAWINPSSPPTNGMSIISKWQSSSGRLSNYRMDFGSGGKVKVGLAKSTQDQNGTSALSTSTINAGEWYHIVGSFDGQTQALKIYVNGNLESTVDTGFSESSVNSGSLTFGRFDFGWSIYQDEFEGLIDEVRIYSRALFDTEIQSLYNSTSSTLVGRAPTEQYSDGLVAHYTFDGSDITTTTVTDVAQGNDGTIHGNVTPVMGRIGQGVHFGGSASHYIEAPHSTDLDATALTLAMWIKTPPTMNCSPTCYRALISKQGQGLSRDYNLYTYTINGETVTRMHFSSAVFGSSTRDLPEPFEPNTWHHVAVTVNSSGQQTYYYDGSQFGSAHQGTSGNANNTYPLWIGRADNSWNGVMDDVRVYNRALSASEILGLYSATRPSSMSSSTDSLVTNGLVGHWSFDPQTIDGTTVADVSGNGNDGIMVGNAAPSSGIMGGAMMFDGSGDYVTIPNSSSLNPGADMTMAMWVSWGGQGGENNMLTKENAYEVRVNGGTVNYATNPWAWRGGSSPQIAQDAWHHVAVTNDADGLQKIYIDGEEKFSTSSGGSITSNSSEVTIGRRMSGSSYFEGLLDDVRIYNRVLTESEVEQLYSMGQ